MRTLVVIIFIVASQLSFAAAKTWTGNTSTAWGTATNWSGNTLPGPNDDITIPTSPTGGRMPTISAGDTIQLITIQTGATLTQTAGNLKVIGGSISITGTYSISGGVLLADKDMTVNSGGLISQSGGTIHMANAIGTDPADDIIIAANGDINQSTGTIDTKNFTTTAGSPDGVFTQSGGTFRIYHDFKNNGTFSSSAGTIEFMGNAGAAGFPSGLTSSNTQFFNVVINSGVNPGFDNGFDFRLSNVVIKYSKNYMKNSLTKADLSKIKKLIVYA